MKTRNAAVLVIGALVWVLAGCGAAEYKDQKTGGEAQMQMVQPGQTLKPPTGAPGMNNVGTTTMPGAGGAPMHPPMGGPPPGAPGR